MYDRDQEMMDYIDEHIVRERTSDAAEDSAGAAWAAYERGEYSVPEWYSKEYRNRGRSPVYNVASKEQQMTNSSFSFEAFLKSMGILFLVIIVLVFIIFIIGYFI